MYGQGRCCGSLEKDNNMASSGGNTNNHLRQSSASNPTTSRSGIAGLVVTSSQSSSTSSRGGLHRILAGPVADSSSSSTIMSRRVETTKSSHKRRLQVHFAPSICVKQVPHLNDLPKDIVRAVWYDSQEYKAIQQGFSETLRLLAAAEREEHCEYDSQDFRLESPSLRASCGKLLLLESSDEHCTRGLEGRTKKGARERNHLKMRTLRAVLWEQERHRCDSNGAMKQPMRGASRTTSPARSPASVATSANTATCHAIARVYRDAGAAMSQESALMQGLKDERQVKEQDLVERDATAGILSHWPSSSISSEPSDPELLLLNDISFVLVASHQEDFHNQSCDKTTAKAFVLTGEAPESMHCSATTLVATHS